MKILVIGSGAREHAIVQSLSLSKRVTQIFCAPANSGMEDLCERVDIAVQDIEGLADFAGQEDIDLTIVGPELPLVLGLVDEFINRGLRVFGPKRAVAELEGSKVFTKNFCQEFAIPTSGFRVFEDAKQARDHIQNIKRYPIVIKADGLAAGKGVIIAQNEAEAFDAISDMLVYQRFGEAGRQIVIEEFIKGTEASLIVMCDGEDFVEFPLAQDHKAVFDNDQGANTGGMGAYAPVAWSTPDLHKKVIERIIKPTLKGMQERGTPYVGFLFAGLMITDEGEPYLLEYNCRLGDPETEVILPLLKTDFVELIEAGVDQRLKSVQVEWHEASAVCVVLASGGYPGEFKTGYAIPALNHKANDGIFVFHGGTKKTQDGFVTGGGRVLTVTAVAPDLKEARDLAYQKVETLAWPECHYRKDIAQKGIHQKNNAKKRT